MVKVWWNYSGRDSAADCTLIKYVNFFWLLSILFLLHRLKYFS